MIVVTSVRSISEEMANSSTESGWRNRRTTRPSSGFEMPSLAA
jgi:hypothetical protein